LRFQIPSQTSFYHGFPAVAASWKESLSVSISTMLQTDGKAQANARIALESTAILAVFAKR
jgi:hypothetical protein